MPFYRSTAIGRDAFAAHEAGDLDAILDAAASASAHGVHKCPVCGKGASAFIEGLRGISQGKASSADAAATLVHSLLPLPLDKKARREERLALGAIYRPAASSSSATAATAAASDGAGGGNRCWLLVRRPDSGLLAGQWEFPHAIVASDKAELPIDPGVEERYEAVSREIALSFSSADAATASEWSRRSLPETIEHVFSHVRHTMHVEFGSAPSASADATLKEDDATWTGSGGRTYCWMAEARMKEVGVTAGVLKVIAAVRGATGGGGGTGKARPNAGAAGGSKKRKAAAASDSVQQRKISAFFGKGGEQ
jgi:hypothetical protein